MAGLYANLAFNPAKFYKRVMGVLKACFRLIF